MSLYFKIECRFNFRVIIETSVNRFNKTDVFYLAGLYVGSNGATSLF